MNTDTLGAGFLEKVYQRALLHELRVEEVLARTDRAVSQLFASLGPGSHCFVCPATSWTLHWQAEAPAARLLTFAARR
jgi:hypothetical protein